MHARIKLCIFYIFLYHIQFCDIYIDYYFGADSHPGRAGDARVVSVAVACFVVVVVVVRAQRNTFQDSRRPQTVTNRR